MTGVLYTSSDAKFNEESSKVLSLSGSGEKVVLGDSAKGELSAATIGQHGVNGPDRLVPSRRTPSHLWRRFGVSTWLFESLPFEVLVVAAALHLPPSAVSARRFCLIALEPFILAR